MAAMANAAAREAPPRLRSRTMLKGRSGAAARGPRAAKPRRSGPLAEGPPPPVQVFGEGAAQQKPERRATSGDRAVKGERPGSLARLRERHRQQRKGRRREQRREGALGRSRDEQDDEALRGAAEDRGQGKTAKTDEECAPAPDRIRDPSSDQQ